MRDRDRLASQASAESHRIILIDFPLSGPLLENRLTPSISSANTRPPPFRAQQTTAVPVRVPRRRLCVSLGTALARRRIDEDRSPGSICIPLIVIFSILPHRTCNLHPSSFSLVHQLLPLARTSSHRAAQPWSSRREPPSLVILSTLALSRVPASLPLYGRHTYTIPLTDVCNLSPA